jgi:hypothetical protein
MSACPARSRNSAYGALGWLSRAKYRRLAAHHRLGPVQAHLQEMAGDVENPPTAPTIGWNPPNHEELAMRYLPLTHQNTKAWNGLSQGDKDVFTRAAGDIVEEEG